MKLISTLHEKILSRTVEENYPYFLYALFQTVSNPIYYFLWYYSDHTTYDSFFARLIINISCFPLLFHKYWPQPTKKFLPYYWHATILYSLPFFFTFMLLKNNFSYEWSLNSLTEFVLCIIFIDATLLSLLLPLGVGLGILFYDISTIDPFYPWEKIQPVIITYGSIIIFGKLFLIRNSMIQQEKQRTLQMQAGAIAHEMRTPLFTLAGIGHYLKKILPSLIQDHQKLSIDQRVEIFSDKQLKHVNSTSEDIEKVTRQAFSFIDSMLMNLRKDFKDAAIETCTIKKCVEDALKQYPFFPKDRELLHIQLDENFEFKGNPLLIKHIFFNLLKNSIYYVKDADKGL